MDIRGFVETFQEIDEVQTIFTVMLRLLCFYCTVMSSDDARAVVYEVISALV